MIPFRKYFEPIDNIRVIAKRFSIRELSDLRKKFGGDRWRKLKGEVKVELLDGSVRLAEIHWYECHGIGKKKIKIKRLLD